MLDLAHLLRFPRVDTGLDISPQRRDSLCAIDMRRNEPRYRESNPHSVHDKLVEPGKDVQLLLYEDEGHSFVKIRNGIDSEVRRVEFLAKVLEK